MGISEGDTEDPPNTTFLHDESAASHYDYACYRCQQRTPITVVMVHVLRHGEETISRPRTPKTRHYSGIETHVDFFTSAQAVRSYTA